MILLDTQAVLWTLAADPRIGPLASARLGSGEMVHVSAISMFELTIKSMIGKLGLPADLIAQLRAAGYVDLPVTAAHASAVRDFPELIRHDPFDRLLVAQSACTGIDLLTADRVLLALGRDNIVDATV